MDPVIKYKRIWCKKCNEFQLHREKLVEGQDHKEHACKTCGTIYSEIYLDEIPKEKVLVQRERYSAWVKTRNQKFYQSFLMGGLGVNSFGLNPLTDSFREDWDELEIIESDAGQRKIDEVEEEEKRKQRELRVIEKQKQRELVKQYSHLNRNDVCSCGSGLKYKKCCLTKIQAIKL